MENLSTYYETRPVISRVPGFADLYADSGFPEPCAPRNRATVKFSDAVDQMDDDDLAAIRKYDRNRSGGFYSG